MSLSVYSLKGYWLNEERRLLQVNAGGWMPPTHAPFAYPEPAPPLGRTQTLETVGIGVTDVVVEVVVAVQTPAVVVGVTTTGGFF